MPLIRRIHNFLEDLCGFLRASYIVFAVGCYRKRKPQPEPLLQKS